MPELQPAGNAVVADGVPDTPPPSSTPLLDSIDLSDPDAYTGISPETSNANAAQQLDPFGNAISTTVSATFSDWDSPAQDNIRDIVSRTGGWFDTHLPGELWNFQANLDRYFGTDNHTYVNEDGLPRWSWEMDENGVPQPRPQQDAAGNTLVDDGGNILPSDKITFLEGQAAREGGGNVTYHGPGALVEGEAAQLNFGFFDLLETNDGDTAALAETEVADTVTDDGAFQPMLPGFETVETVDSPVETETTVEAVDNAVETEASNASGSTLDAEFENGALSVEATDGANTVGNLDIDGSVAVDGYTPINGSDHMVGGGGIELSPDGQLTVMGQGGVRVPVGEDHLTALGYGSLTFDETGRMTGFGGGASAEFGNFGGTFAVGFQDGDFAGYTPGQDGEPGQISYGQNNGWNAALGGQAPIGPFTVGAEGHMQRSTNVSVFASEEDFADIDPALAQTDPEAYRLAVEAAMATRIEGVETRSDLTASDIAAWGPGSGITLSESGSEGGSATFGVGPVGVEGGYDQDRVEETTITNTEDGGFEVTVTNVDGDTWRSGLNVGPFGAQGSDRDETMTSVTFTVSDPAALDAYLTTGVLPGALEYAQAQGLVPADFDLADPDAVSALANDVNGAFLLANENNEVGPETADATYTDMVFSDLHRDQVDLSVLGFDVLSSMDEERWTEQLYNVDGDWETNFLYDQRESWLFNRDTHTSGISVNPEAGPFIGMYSTLNADHDFVSENGLTDLMDPNDPFTQLWMSGDLQTDGAPTLSIAVGLGEQELADIDAALDAVGSDDERLSEMDENIDTRLINFIGDNSDMEFEVDDDGNMIITNVPSEVNIENLAPYMGVNPEEAAALFDGMDEAEIVQSFATVINADPSDFETLSPLEQELYLRTGLESYDDSNHFQTTEGNPFEVLGLIADVEDPETRDAMIRRTFYAAEQQEDGAQGPLMFLEFAETMPDELNDRLREGAVVRVSGEVDALALMEESNFYGRATLESQIAALDPEDRTLFLQNLGNLADWDAIRDAWMAERPGETYPFDGMDPAMAVFGLLDDPVMQAELIASYQDTPYAQDIVDLAASNPELFLDNPDAQNDPAALDFAVNHLFAISGIDPISVVGDPATVFAAMATSPEILADYVDTFGGDEAWAEQFIGMDGGALLAQFANDEEAYGPLLDALETAGFDRTQLQLGVLEAEGDFDPLAAANQVAADPGQAGQWARDREQSHNFIGQWNPDTGDMTLALGSVVGDAEASAAFVDGYLNEAFRDNHGGDVVTNMLGAYDGRGSAAELQLAMDVLRDAGYGAEVDAWVNG